MTMLTCGAALAVALLCNARDVFAQRKGGNTTSNNVAVSIDWEASVVRIKGDGGPNMFVVSVWDSNVFVSPGPWNQTTINGVSQDLSFGVPFEKLTILIEAAGGDDRVWVTTSQTDMPLDLAVNGGQGSDELEVYHSVDSQVLDGDLWIEGGAGDDDIGITGVAVSGDLTVLGGDNNDAFTVVDSTWNGGFAPTVGGVALLDGGKGRNVLSAPAFFLLGADVTGFQTIVAD